MTNHDDHEGDAKVLGCEDVLDWIWGVRIAAESPPAAVDHHLGWCEPCGEERAARAALSEDLRGLRSELSEQPRPVLDRRVLAAAASAVAIRERGAVADTPAPASPPVATPRWMTIAAALLAGGIGLGFLAGRFTATGIAGFAEGLNAPPVHTTLATAAAGQIDWRNMHRPHEVGISPDGLTRLQDGRTYLMTGPIGGPYQVVGAVHFENVRLPSTFPAGGLKEIVVAVGPVDGWHTGRELALADLSASGAEILGRRKVEDPPVRVGYTAP
jgi:hypothetical protein